MIGFDTGPGNVLIDSWVHHHQQKFHDENGKCAAQGQANAELLQIMLADAYFQLSSPKSTGREYFNLDWLQRQLQKLSTTIAVVDVQTTLVELTARSIMQSIHQHLTDGEILICGGGVHNAFLMQRLTEMTGPSFLLKTTADYGLDPVWVEAIAFAWLAQQTLHQKPGNLPSVTGAKQFTVLGGVYYAC